jgi:hypothetical protein
MIHTTKHSMGMVPPYHLSLPRSSWGILLCAPSTVGVLVMALCLVA